MSALEPLSGVSVITTVFNEEKSITEFLDSYRIQSQYADEIVILDGGSTDRTVDIIRNYASTHPEINIRLKIDTSCNRKKCIGPIARGRNLAIKAATNDFIFVTDAGCRLDEHWVREMGREMACNERAVLAGWYEPICETKFAITYSAAMLPTLQQVDRTAFLPSSRNIGFSRHAWKAVGGYPELTYTAEDTYFDILLAKAGFSFSFVESAKVYWHCPTTLSEAVRKQFSYGRGDGQLKIFKRQILRMTVNCIFPVKIYLGSLSSVRTKSLKHLLLITNIAGYLVGLASK